jgi:hypothetical protein
MQGIEALEVNPVGCCRSAACAVIGAADRHAAIAVSDGFYRTAEPDAAGARLTSALWSGAPRLVPPTRIVSASRSKASLAVSGFPVRTASISSGHAHEEKYVCLCSLACQAASASW